MLTFNIEIDKEEAKQGAGSGICLPGSRHPEKLNPVKMSTRNEEMEREWQKDEEIKDKKDKGLTSMTPNKKDDNLEMNKLKSIFKEFKRENRNKEKKAKKVKKGKSD